MTTDQATHDHSPYRAPADCPVCAGELLTTRLGCPGCSSEVGGRFQRCRFCALDTTQLELLTVFLASRGNLREVAKQQQVSYPTARARISGLLAALGIEEIGGSESEPEPEPVGEPRALTRDELLAAVAEGRLEPSEAARLIAGL